MSDTPNYFAAPNQTAGMGGAFGGGLVGGLIGNGALGGFGGSREGGVTPAQLQSALNGLQETMQNTTVMQSLGDIKAQSPLTQANLEASINASQNAVVNAIGQQAVANANGFGAVRDSVNQGNAANQLGLAQVQNTQLQTTMQLAQAISTDGERTRSELTRINEANLNRMITERDIKLAEATAQTRHNETQYNIVNSNVNTGRIGAGSGCSPDYQIAQALNQLVAGMTALTVQVGKLTP